MQSSQPVTLQRLPLPVAELHHSHHELLSVKAKRNIRLLFWVYSIALFSGTHYPKVEIGIEGDSPDKLIHFLALGMWGILIWGSGYVRRPVSVLCATLAFSVFDETTQLIPGLGRVFDRYDLIADSMGAVLAMIWVYALSSAHAKGSSPSEFDNRNALIANQIFGSWTNILQIMISTSLGSMLGCVAFILIFTPFDFLGVYTLALLGLEIGGLLGLGISYRFAHQAMARRMGECSGTSLNLVIESIVVTCVFAGFFIPGILLLHPPMSRLELGDLGIAGIFCLLLAGLAWWVRSCRLRGTSA